MVNIKALRDIKTSIYILSVTFFIVLVKDNSTLSQPSIYSLITKLLLPLLVTLGIYLFVCWFVYLCNLLFG